jgi:ketol-acid reductoisomerase
MSTAIYYEKDADLNRLKGRRLAILGYGSQGRAHALNLRDSGLDVTVGVRADGQTMKLAQADGLKATTVEEAVKGADLVAFLFPDPSQPAVYRDKVAPTLKAGQTLLFAHGFNVHYGQIVPPAGVDVVMIAPKSPGNMMRRLFEVGQGVPCLLAVAQDASGQAKATALAYAHGLGGTRAGVFETSFKEETETDLFGEQAVLCGGVCALIKAGFETLIAAGYAPEMAYFECCHELKLIVDLIYQGGLAHMRRFVSDTAKYGDITRGPMVVTAEVKAAMARILADVQNGAFAREWVMENQAHRPVYSALLRSEAEHPIETVGAKLRGMMPFLNS